MSSSSTVLLRWSGSGLRFEGGPEDGPQIAMDSDGRDAPSPTQLLLLSLAGCMGVDIRLILEKSRVPVESLEIEIDGARAESPPRRFEAIRMRCVLHGPAEQDRSKIDRAIDLSRDKYCSVLHSLDPGIGLEIAVELV